MSEKYENIEYLFENLDEEVTSGGKFNKKRDVWGSEETGIFLALLQQVNIMKLMDSKKFRTNEIFDHVKKKFKEMGFQRTSKQLTTKYKALKQDYKQIKSKLDKSGAGSDAADHPHYDALHELFGHRPVATQHGLDSIGESPSMSSSTRDDKKLEPATAPIKKMKLDHDEKSILLPAASVNPRSYSSHNKKSHQSTIQETIENLTTSIKKDQEALMITAMERQSRINTQFLEKYAEVNKTNIEVMLNGLRSMLQSSNYPSYSQFSGSHSTFVQKNDLRSNSTQDEVEILQRERQRLDDKIARLSKNQYP